jgi:hypothetical protein
MSRLSVETPLSGETILKILVVGESGGLKPGLADGLTNY